MGLAVLAKRGGALCAAFALAALGLFFSAPRASADIEFCPPGEEAGQCGVPQRIGAQRGLAVDTESGRLYVADESNNRIDVFEANGDFLYAFGWGVDSGAAQLEKCTTASTCQAGIAGSGAGQFDRPVTVTVDNDPVSPSQHAIYVSDLGEDEGIGKDHEHPRVQKFDPAGEFVWMAGKEVDKTDSGDLCAKVEVHTCGKAAKSSAVGGFSSAPFIAACPTGGALYAVDNVRPSGDTIQQRLQRFEPSGAPIPPPAILLEGNLTFARAMALDAACNLWVTGQGAGLRKYDPIGNPTAGPFEAAASFARNGLAIDAAGDIYTGQSEQRDKASGSFNVIAAFHPASPSQPFRRFAYTEANVGSFGNSINGLAAHASAFGEFFFSLTNESIAGVFQPSPGPIPAPPSLEVKELGSTKATLVAEVNPEGKATEVHFEYLTQKEYEDQGESFIGPAAKKTSTESLGAEGFNLKATEATIGCPNPSSEAGEPGKCLLPATEYRWRVVAENADNPAGAGDGTVEGPPFTTKESPEFGEIYVTRVDTDTARLNGEVNPTGLAATGFFEYVDDDAYEQDIGEGGDGFAAAIQVPDVGAGQAPLDFGSGEAFLTRQVAIYPLDPGTVYHYRLVAANELVEPRESDAEELRTFEPPEVENCPPNQASRIGPGAFLPDCRAYEMVSPVDKAAGDIRVLNSNSGLPLVLEQSSTSGERLAYGSIRSFGDAASAPFTSQYIAQRIAGAEWRTHSINSPREKPTLPGLAQFDVEFRAFSADLCDVWQTSFAEPLLAPGAQAGYSNLYRRTDELCAEDGKAHYEALAPIEKPASIPPGPNVTPVPNFLMELLDVSADGEHAVFLANDKLRPEGSGGNRQLYEHARGAGVRFVCILPEGGGPVSGSCTAGSAPAGEAVPQMGRISSDGEEIFWSAPGTGEGKVYVRIGGTQTVAVSQAGEEQSGTNQSLFWGAAADGSKALFSTSDTGAGISDLYEFDIAGKTTTLIAKEALGVVGMSENANRVYFASKEVLSGEEANSNGDKAEAGKANLYLREANGDIEFVATLGGGGGVGAHIGRVTSDGAHAAFVSTAPLTGYDNKGAQSGVATAEIFRYDAAAGELSCVSCNPSGARPAGSSSIPSWETAMHAARLLSDDGARLFFESADSLAALDTNGRVDVYQWEELGSGGCDEADVGFSAAAGGCVQLISSGQSPLDSRFVESSPIGEDVFFATGASLLPQDSGVVDIYDARVGGGLPVPPPPIPPCEGDACAAQIPAPEEPTPASSSYVGAPEASKGKPAKRRCPKGKRRVIRKGKSHCVPKHKRRRAGR